MTPTQRHAILDEAARIEHAFPAQSAYLTEIADHDPRVTRLVLAVAAGVAAAVVLAMWAVL